MAEDETLATVGTGTVLRYSKENGAWLLIPRYGGWLNRDSAIALENGEQHFGAMLQSKPTAEAFHLRGIVRSELGRWPDAISDFDEALNRGGPAASILVNRGLAFQRSGDREKALADFSESLAKNAGETLALLNRSSLRLELRQLDLALADVDAILAIDPEMPEALNNRGVILRLQGRFVEAIDEYNRAIEVSPKYAVAYANRGYARKQLGEFEAALDDYAKAQKYDPMLVNAFNDAAWLLATCRDAAFRNPDEAVKAAEQARDLSGGSAGPVLDTLAAAYASAGRFDDAVATAEVSLKTLTDADRPAAESRLEQYRKREAFVEP